MARAKVSVLIALAMLACFPALPAFAGAPGAGFAAFAFDYPQAAAPIEAVVFYPAQRPTEASVVGQYRIAAERDAPMAPGGPRPLVLISHGHAGSQWGHHDLAEHLARQGFVVAAILHPGDNYRDQSGFGKAQQLLGRPRQISALLTKLLTDPRFGPAIDAGRVGVAGFSAGGYTSLALVGANPDFGRVTPYCQRHPDDPEICRGYDASAAALHRPKPGELSDPRIRAAFVMAPLSIFFDQTDLTDIKVPVFLAYASRDQVLLPDENAARIEPFLASLQGREIVAGADHFVFLSPCSPERAAQSPRLCEDPPGIERAAVHDRLNALAAHFFAQALGKPVAR